MIFNLEPRYTELLQGLGLAALRWVPHFWGALLRLTTAQSPAGASASLAFLAHFFAAPLQFFFLLLRSRMPTSSVSTSRFSEIGLQRNKYSSQITGVPLASEENRFYSVASWPVIKVKAKNINWYRHSVVKKITDTYHAILHISKCNSGNWDTWDYLCDEHLYRLKQTYRKGSIILSNRQAQQTITHNKYSKTTEISISITHTTLQNVPVHYVCLKSLISASNLPSLLL